MNSPLRKENESDLPRNPEANTSGADLNMPLTTANEPEGPTLVRNEGRSDPISHEKRADQGSTAATVPVSDGNQSPRETENGPLFPAGELRELQARWDQIQTGFVDQPRAAVHDAEQLVSSAMERLSDVFADERAKLERQWSGGSVSTEDLRMSFQRYRSFFRRLLSM